MVTKYGHFVSSSLLKNTIMSEEKFHEQSSQITNTSIKYLHRMK